MATFPVLKVQFDSTEQNEVLTNDRRLLRYKTLHWNVLWHLKSFTDKKVALRQGIFYEAFTM